MTDGMNDEFDDDEMNDGARDEEAGGRHFANVWVYEVHDMTDDFAEGLVIP